MASRFQAVTLVASPSYPNSVAWSDENLLAVASGHIVTILNPSKLYGPRGLIVLPPSKPFRIGVIKREDLLSGCLLPTCLSRDCRPCVRSISWSPLGLAPNSGCLLAVCTTEGRVKLYRMPFCEFSAEWVELMDLSDMLLDYLVNINFLELNSSSQSCGEQTTDVHMGSGCEDDLPIAVLKKKHKQTRANKWSAVNKDLGTPELQFLHHCNSKNATTGSTRQTENHFTAFLEDKIFPCSILQESPLVEVLRLDGSRRVWVPGILECCTGVKAHAMFREIDGKHDEIVEIDLEDDEICGDFCKNSGATGSNKFPKVRPSIHLGNLPENLASSIGVEKYLSIGQAVEVWTNNRWVEGLFMGFDKARLLVKFCGDHDSVILSPNSVRLAPVWISDRESWRVTVVKIEMKGQELPEVAVTNSKAKGINPSQIVPMPESEVERLKEIPENCSFPQITADEYASRTALLSSLVVAWLPTLLLSSKSVPVPLSNSSKCCSLLAIGGKSGKISFWRINGPHHYSIENGGIKNAAMLVGLLHAHDAWITTIDWASLASDASNSRVLLATGSSDGSVKLWIGSCEGLLKSSEVNYAPFLLLYEVSLVGSISVSVLSVVCPPQDQHKNILAIGRVSGSFEVWICDLSTSKFDKVGSYDVHDRVVTGLAWAFDGNCLYSCGQDYSVRGWILHKRSLFEATIPSNNLDAKCSVDIPNASDSCFGVDVSSGNMVLAVGRKEMKEKFLAAAPEKKNMLL